MKFPMFVCTISYVEKGAEAAHRIRRGERQLYCGICGQTRGPWRWPEECEHEGRLTQREFNTMVREAHR